MKVAIPVLSDEGLESQVNEHFGSAPLFLLVDTETRSCQPIHNNNSHHAHGMCQPVAALGGHEVDGVVVGGIGMGALMKLRSAGIEVYLSRLPTVKETVEAMAEGRLQPVAPENACRHHGQQSNGRGQHGQGQCGHDGPGRQGGQGGGRGSGRQR